ncbi:hypothetical protein [Micromonospora musae]|nr:hypothetical protein [Micromonospora musae]
MISGDGRPAPTRTARGGLGGGELRGGYGETPMPVAHLSATLEE